MSFEARSDPGLLFFIMVGELWTAIDVFGVHPYLISITGGEQPFSALLADGLMSIERRHSTSWRQVEMPTGSAIALHFLYALSFIWFCLGGMIPWAAPWLSSHYGILPMWSFIAVDIGILVSAIALINKIHRDWPTFDAPPKISAPMWRVGQQLSYQRQSAQSAKSLPIEQLVETDKSAAMDT